MKSLKTDLQKYLLKNEISILKKFDSINILKIYDVY